MAEKLYLMILIVFSCAALWAIPAHAQDSVDAPVAEDAADAIETVASGWYRTTINGTSAETGLGQNAIAVRTDGKSFVSYFNATKRSLDVAMQVLPLQGNCGTDQAWVCMTVEDSDTLEVGAANAIGIYPLTNLPAVVYTVGDPANHVHYALKFAVATGCTTTCSWSISTIASFASGYSVENVDMIFSTSENTPHVAYTVSHVDNSQDDNYKALYYATIAGSGNCAGGASGWQCALIDDGGRAVLDIAIGLNAVSRPRIAYTRYDKSGDTLTNSWILSAAYTVNSGNCGPNSTWTCSQLRQFSGYAPSTIDMAMDGSEPHIAYVNMPSNNTAQQNLVYMTLDLQDLAGNCGPGNQWHCAELEDTGAYGKPSIALRQGTPYIAYTDKNDIGTREILKLATPQAVGNCGPVNGLFFSWNCEQIDNGATLNGAHPVGLAPAMGYDAQRFTLEIAYGDNTTRDLVIVENHRPAPVLSAVSKNAVTVGSATTQVLITGKNFAADAWAVLDNTYVPTERLSSTQVRATIDANALKQITTYTLRVCNPPFPLTDCSNTTQWQVTAAKMYLPVVVE